MKRIIFTSLFLVIYLIGHTQAVENYLQTDKTINFNGEEYNLVWSSHPKDNYYKQEYLTKNQSLETFKSMILIDFIEGDYLVKDAVNAQIKVLDKAKISNPIISYNVLEKEGEAIIDFLMTSNSTDGDRILIAERNVYRYQRISTKTINGILVFAISCRAYENEIEAFLKDLTENENELVAKIGDFKVPKISPEH